MKLWAGRFQKETDTLVNDFNASINFDARLYRQDITGSIAHATMLGEQGIISQEDAQAIINGLKAILSDIEGGGVEFSLENEDIHMNIETILTQRIGEAGKRLSGGEKQRIAIARMMLKNAPIVILDEATAFTDPENEDKIQRSIAALTRSKTLLVIAHRLSTIKNADNIVVLKNGAIVAQGTQEQLLEKCPLYQDMWRSHIGAKNWAVSTAAKEA